MLNSLKQSKAFYLLVFVIYFFSVTIYAQKRIPKPNSLVVAEQFKNPIGFYNKAPNFSWKLPVHAQVKSQHAYQIRVASSLKLLNNKCDLWDTGKQNSSKSNWIAYKGKPLQSRQKVYWQVRYWNQNKKKSNWSTVNTFELGLLNNTDWQAKWTGLDTAKDSLKGVRNFLVHRPQYLRKSFQLPSRVAKARMYITAKGVFDVHLNGKDVSNDVMTPGWTPYNHRIETLTYDVTSFLQTGKNAIAVELASGWHSGRINRGKSLYENFASPKILCQLEVTLKDGSKKIIVSDESWKGTTNGPLRLAGVYDGETYDANFEMPNWTAKSFNTTTWQDVETEEISKTVNLAPKRHHTVKNQTIIKDVDIISVKENSVVFNVKQNIVGIPKVKVPMKKGDTLRIRFSEMVLKDNTFYTKNYRSAKSTDYYIAAKDGVIEYAPKFTFHGFQYIELSGYDKKAKPNVTWVQAIAQHSNFDKNGSFTSSHKKLNQLQSNITWGLRDNFFDIPTDCPQRDERLGWTGDAQVIAPTALFNYNTHAFWTAWLQSLRENQSEHKDGMVPFVVPDVLQTKNGSSGWGDASVIIPWDIYKFTGDITILEESYESAKKWVAYYQSKIRKKPFLPKMHSFADWLQPYPSKTGKLANRGDTPKDVIHAAFFAHSANLISKIAAVLGKTDDEKKYKTLHKSVANAFEKAFFNEGRFTGTKQTQTSYLLAIHFNLLKPENKLKAQNYLLEEIKKADNHLGTGFLGTPILPKVLDNMGEIDLMYEILFKETYPSWFYSINQGATTMWERWNSFSKESGFNTQSMNSLNHYAYGAIGQWMYERIAGLSSLAPGYKKIKIAPIPNTKFLTSASASLNTLYGTASSSWKIENNTFYLNVEVPPNTTAEIHIPTTQKESILLNGIAVKKNKNINLVAFSNTSLTLLVKAGTYKIQSNFK